MCNQELFAATEGNKEERDTLQDQDISLLNDAKRVYLSQLDL